MDSAFSRIKLLIDDHDFTTIRNSRVMIVGCGGVGAMCAEALARFGVGSLVLVDNDVVDITNVNRQVHALYNNVGQKKVDALKNRVLAIQPTCKVTTYDLFVDQTTLDVLMQEQVDVIVDAIDTISSKLLLIKYAQAHNINIVSCMGMGNRFDPTQVQIMPLKKTTNDPLARVMRYEGRKQALDMNMLVVSSLEIPIKQRVVIKESSILKEAQPPASSSFVPMAAGLACGYQAMKYIIEKEAL